MRKKLMRKKSNGRNQIEITKKKIEITENEIKTNDETKKNYYQNESLTPWTARWWLGKLARAGSAIFYAAFVNTLIFFKLNCDFRADDCDRDFDFYVFIIVFDYPVNFSEHKLVQHGMFQIGTNEKMIYQKKWKPDNEWTGNWK